MKEISKTIVEPVTRVRDQQYANARDVFTQEVTAVEFTNFCINYDVFANMSVYKHWSSMGT